MLRASGAIRIGVICAKSKVKTAYKQNSKPKKPRTLEGVYRRPEGQLLPSTPYSVDNSYSRRAP